MNRILIPIANPGSWAALSWISDLTDTEQKAVFGATVALVLLILVLSVWCVCLLQWRRTLFKKSGEIVASHAARLALTNTLDGSAPPSSAHSTITVTSASDIGMDSGGSGGGGHGGQHTFRFKDTSKVVVEAGERFVIVMVRPHATVAQDPCPAPGGLPEPALSGP